MRKLLFGAVAVLFLGSLLCGCNEIEKARFDEIKLGMSKETVKEIMNKKPWTEEKDVIIYTGSNVVKVQFTFDEDGKLIKKEWLAR